MKAPTLYWPTTPDGILLYSQLVFAWMVAHYVVWSDPIPLDEASEGERTAAADTAKARNTRLIQVDWSERNYRRALVLVRALLLGGIGLCLAGAVWRGAVLMFGTMSLSYALPSFREWAARRSALAEYEIVLNGLYLVFAAGVVAWSGAEISLAYVLLVFPVSDARLAAVFVVLSALAFLGRGGTFIVRGFLTKVGTLPKYEESPSPDMLRLLANVKYDGSKDEWVVSGTGNQEVATKEQGGDSAAKVDPREVSRGRLIGIVERLLLTLLAMVGSYPAIGFLVAAKGLVRAKEFEDRNYAEYFLVGTLVSTALALATGTLLRIVGEQLWALRGG